MNANISILRIKQETHDTKTLITTKPEGFSYVAGQYVMLGLTDKKNIHGKETIPITLSSSPHEQELHFTIKDAGAFSEAIYNAKEGDKLFLRGPAGDAYNVTTQIKDDMVLLAAGTGITPFHSILTFIIEEGMNNSILLLNGNRSEEDIIFKTELEQFDKQDNITVINVLENPSPTWRGEQGLVDKKLIEKHVPNPRDYTFMICGPPPMVHDCKEALLELGVEEENIKIDPWEIAAKGRKKN